MTRRALAVWVLAAATATPASAQTAVLDVTQSVGTSSEAVSAAGVQVRALAEPSRGLRLVAEGAWGDRRGPVSDVFGTAYPYGGRIDVIEAYAEWVRRGTGLRAVRVGRYRTPFGMSGASDHAYLGFLRPPLIRYGSYYALSTGYLEHGLDVLAGAGPVSIEGSVGRPGDVGDAIRRPGTTRTGRAEVAGRGLVIGLSAIDTTPYLPATFAKGRARYTGVDLRWMRNGVQVRGEWLDGQPFDGTTTTGGYLDAIVHTRRMDRVTALARVETLDYDTTSRFALKTHRLSAGARMRLWQQLAISAGLAHQFGQQTQHERTALDAGITWAWRTDLWPRR